LLVNPAIDCFDIPTVEALQFDRLHVRTDRHRETLRRDPAIEPRVDVR